MQREEAAERSIAQLRVPPHSIEAESAVLGAVLLDNAHWDRLDGLSEADFYRFEHRLIFGVIASLAAEGRAADAITVYERLQALGKAADAGGLPYLTRLTSYESSAPNVKRYAEIVRDRAVLRHLATVGDEVATIALNPGERTASECVDQAQQKLHEIHAGSGRVMPTSIAGSVVSLIDRVTAAREGRKQHGIPTHIPMLDRMLGGGLKGGKQIILAARPSIGKSSLAEQICLNVAVKERVGAAFLSQEMTKDELTDRAAANLGRIQLDRLISGRFEHDDETRFNEAIERLRGVPLYLDEQPALTLGDIAAKARMLKRQHGVKLIVIDYIQLCASGKDETTRHHQIEQLSRGIKTLAKQLDICFITLSQLNREVEKRTNGRPILSDLKESGSIEEDADVVMLMSRSQTTSSGIQLVNLDVPKNRQGRTGSVCLAFEGPYQRWEESAVPVEWKSSQPKKSFTEDV